MSPLEVPDLSQALKEFHCAMLVRAGEKGNLNLCST
jgi:hypothetical protein